MTLLSIAVLAVAGCAQAVSQEETKSGESASGGEASSGEEKTSENTSERFQEVIASYEVVQSEIDEAGGEQEVGEYRVS